MSELHRLSIEDARRALLKREITSLELTTAILARIKEIEPHIGAFITVSADLALKQARAADERLAGGETPALCGIPVSIKDVILTRSVRSTAASKILGDFVPAYDATVTRKLLDAGAVCIGKVNCDEFAMGSSTENSGFAVTHNPWNVARVPGGSSGGSAASVAAGQGLGSLGTDTGGSIRQPAAFCGVVGMKPTYGRVSRYGVVAYASSLDQVGPLGKTVSDCAFLLEAIAGHDRRDSTSIDQPAENYHANLRAAVKGLRLGLPREYFVTGMQPEVEQSVRTAVRVFEELGAQVVEVSLPHTEYAIPAYYLVATAEASSNLARYDGLRYGRRSNGDGLLDTYQRTREEGFGTEVKRRIMLGTYALSAGYYDAYYLKALKVRTLIRNDFLRVFEACDAILTPTTPTTAFAIGAKTDDPLQMYLQDVFTVSVNLAGLPGLSLPCGFDAEGLPIGLQIIGRPLDEQSVLNVAYAYEQATEWHRRTPEICSQRIQNKESRIHKGAGSDPQDSEF
jgi:aspartyl-tRNA(Asn)/glutamyl-tRNA(Gln) amidotransferase subunit A